MKQKQEAYQALCTEFYYLDKPTAPKDALAYYMKWALLAQGPILEPMCGTGSFLIPMLRQGYDITGFDYSQNMLDVCINLCNKENLPAKLSLATFDNFKTQASYHLIFIPSGSFSLLTEEAEIDTALKFVSQHLAAGGKFVFEVETLQSVSKHLGIWNGTFVTKSDGSKIVISSLPRFDEVTKVQTSMNKYELWEQDSITQTELEIFKLRFYELNEMDHILNQYGLEVNNKLVPYTQHPPDSDTETILYECTKKAF